MDEFLVKTELGENMKLTVIQLAALLLVGVSCYWMGVFVGMKIEQGKQKENPPIIMTPFELPGNNIKGNLQEVD
jgi:hypothetical protein